MCPVVFWLLLFPTSPTSIDTAIASLSGIGNGEKGLALETPRRGIPRAGCSFRPYPLNMEHIVYSSRVE